MDAPPVEQSFRQTNMLSGDCAAPSARQSTKSSKTLSGTANKNLSLVPTLWFATLAIWCLTQLTVIAATTLDHTQSSAPAGDNQQQDPAAATASAKGALENELNSIVQQHYTGSPNGNAKLLTEAIISRLMLDNLTSSQIDEQNPDVVTDFDMGLDTIGGSGGETYVDQQAPSPAERWKLKKLLSMAQNYDMGTSTGVQSSNNQAYDQYPVLPSSQGTMKRAAIRMGNLLLRQQQQQQRQLNGYGRNNFDFGLGKRPDSMMGVGNVLRLGDSSMGSDGRVQVLAAGQYGKRPSAHRYDFGLGKRVVSTSDLLPGSMFSLATNAPDHTLVTAVSTL